MINLAKLKINTKKESGDIGQILPSLITVFVVFFLITFYLNTMQALELKNNLDMLARQYIIRMETYGKLTDDDADDLKDYLIALGCPEDTIDFTGTDRTEVGYGNQVTLNIQGEIPVKRLDWLSGLNTSSNIEYIPFSIRKASTGKY